MGRRGRPPYPDILTPREWEVLELLRAGLTNEAIADRLGISHAGARFHVSQILSKLGVSTRQEAAAWQPALERRPWWTVGPGWLQRAALGKAALITAAVALLAGFGVLVWAGLSGAEDADTHVRATATRTPSATAAPTPARAPSPAVAARGRLPMLLPGPYKVPLDGSEPQRLVAPSLEALPVTIRSELVTSPDGEWVGWVRGNRMFPIPNPGIDLVRTTTGEVRSITSFESVNAAGISPGGIRVLVDGVSAGQAGLYLVDVPSGAITRVAEGPRGGRLVGTTRMQWSPVSERVAYDGCSGVCVVDLSTGGVDAISLEISTFAWAPDGQSLAIASNTDVFYVPRGPGIYLAGLEGDPTFVHSINPRSVETVAFSPDGATIAYDYLADLDAELPHDWRVVVVSTSGVVQAQWPGRAPAWSRDGTRLAYTLDGAIYTRAPDGTSEQHLLTPRQPSLTSPLWLPGDAAIVATYAPPSGSEIYQVSAGDGAESLIAYGSFPSWSPDGRSIAFQANGSSASAAGVYMMRLDGSGSRHLRSYQTSDSGGCFASDIVWSPDGEFVTFTDWKQRIIFVPVGSRPKPAVGAGACLVAWSPDGVHVAHSGGHSIEDDRKIAVLDIESGKGAVLTYGTGVFAWSPDGTQLAFIRRDGYYAIDSDGTGERRIAAADFSAEFGMYSPRTLIWSPDGLRLLAVEDEPGTDSSNVVTVDIATGAIRTVAQGSDPIWSPDGRQIAFVSGDPPAVFLVDAAGGEPTLLTEGFQPAWSPDGDTILVVR